MIKTLYLGILLLCCVQLQSQTPFVCDGTFYITLVRNGSTALVAVDIDPNTEQVEFIEINNNLGTIVNGIGYRAQDNFIYGVHPRDYLLYRIDRFGTIEVLAELPLTDGYFYLGADITEDGKYLILMGSVDVEGFPLDRELVMIDLESPDYTTTFKTITGANVNMLDIAFDPTDQKLYGFDSAGNRLATLTLDGVVTADFEPSTLLENAGSMFFDIFGNLFAYGSPEGRDQNTLYAVSKVDGSFRILATGDIARATDACSCPHSVELQKTVFPTTTIACGIVNYTFAISNQSERPHDGIILQDLLPSGFTITDIVRNPFGGIVQSGVGSGILQITDMNVPAGIDSIVIEVEIDELPAGRYRNQAQLFGLPVGLGESRISDDPRTLVKRDSTTLIIESFDQDTIDLDDRICTGDMGVLDASRYGVSFTWDDLSTDPTREIDGAGTYTVEARSLCDTILVRYFVQETAVDLVVDQSLFEIELGDSVALSSTVFQTGDTVSYEWLDPDVSTLECYNCPATQATPFRDIEYLLRATDEFGCMDSARVEVKVDRSHIIYVPNVFSPNGDDINDQFYIVGKGVDVIDDFAIFNRFGGKVFGFTDGQANDLAWSWDGLINGKIARPGVYVWMAEISYRDGTSEFVGGDVTLMR